MAAYQESLLGDSKHERNKTSMSFESWILRKGPGPDGREKIWANVDKERMHRSSDDLADELRKKGKSGMDALFDLTTVQQRHVSSLLEDKRQRERHPDAEWSWVRIDLDFVGKVSRAAKRPSKDARAICVILQRNVKIAESNPSITKPLDKRFRKMNLHEDDEHVV